MCLNTCICTWVPMEAMGGVGSPGIMVACGCEPPHMGVGNRNQIWVLCKSSMCSQLLSHLSSPKTGASFCVDERTIVPAYMLQSGQLESPVSDWRP